MSISDHSNTEHIRVTAHVPALRGEMADGVRRVIKARLEERLRPVYLSLPETRLMDSQGVSMLLYFHHILKRGQMTIRIVDPPAELVVFLKNMALDFMI